MNSEGRPSRWWETPGLVRHTVAGVFEGGGAKGVAYAGALEVLLGRHMWFGSVAGASAGAITAALIAAGVAPGQLEKYTVDALRQIPWPKSLVLRYSRAFWNLWNRAGAINKHNLRNWLDDVFRKQMKEIGGEDPGRGITFKELYDLTEIELNVVAADLSVRRQIVFNHRDTPACGVADAVVASSSIPAAFPSSDLMVPSDRTATGWIGHTVVDGGVWTNFPLFVFTDGAYRRSRGLPERHSEDYLIGFLLDEEGEAISMYETVNAGEIQFNYKLARFRSGFERGFIANEWEEHRRGGTRVANSFLGACIFGLFSMPLFFERYLLGAFDGAIGRFFLGAYGMTGRSAWARWPSARHTITAAGVSFADGTLGLMSFALIGLLTWVFVALGTASFILNLIDSVAGGDDQIIRVTLLSFLLPVSLAVFCFLCLSFLGFICNMLLYPVIRRIGYGLAATYAAGPGAPPWVTLTERIVAIPVPKGVSVLSFDMSDEQRDQLIESARVATTQFLERLE